MSSTWARLDRTQPLGDQNQDGRLCIYLLGGFHIGWEGCAGAEPVWERPLARTLVKLLATTPGHRLHREQIIDVLWPDADLEAGLNSLGKALYQARRALEPDLGHGRESRYLQLAEGVLQLAPQHVWIDADEFEHLASQAIEHAEGEALHAAREAYGGELLPEHRYDDWASTRRDRLQDLYLTVCEALAGVLERRGDLDGAVKALQTVLDLDEIREETHRALMRLYALDGDRRAALRQYEHLHHVLHRELDTEPEEETCKLRDRIARGLIGPPPAAPQALERIASSRLFGRSEALAFLEGCMKRAATGHGEMVLIGGEAGVGKTRLAAETMREAHQRGWVVLYGASYEDEGRLPYGALVEALEEFLRSRDPADRSALAETHLELAPLLPALGQGRPSLPDTYSASTLANVNPTRLFAAVARVLGNLGAERRLLLVLDDFHSADVGTLQLAHYLGRSAAREPWLIVCTYREENVVPGGELQRFLADSTREGMSRRVDLRALDRSSTERLIAEMLPGATTDPPLFEELYRRSLGNPLYLQELVRGMRETRQLEVHAGHWRIAEGTRIGVPPQVRDLVRARVDRMSAGVRSILDIAATTGMRATFPVIREAALMLRPPLQEDAILDALDGATNGRILEEAMDGYVFRHPLLREALYDRLSRQRRSRLHGLVAQAIERLRSDDVDALAHHYLRSVHKERAIPYLERAAQRALNVYAHEAAREHYATMAHQLDAMERRVEAARARVKLGRQLSTLGRYPEAHSVLEEALKIFGAVNDVDYEAITLAEIGNTYFLSGSAHIGAPRLKAAVSTLERASPYALAQVYLSLIYLVVNRLASGWQEESRAISERAMELARTSGDFRLESESYLRLAFVLIGLGELTEALDLLKQCMEVNDENGDIVQRGTAYSFAGEVCLLLGDARQARLYAEQTLELARRYGDAGNLSYALTQACVTHWVLGDWQRARAYATENLEVLEQLRDTYTARGPHLAMLRIACAEGNWKEAEAHVSALASLGSGVYTTMLPAAEFALAQGRPNDAVETVEQLLTDGTANYPSVFLLCAEVFLRSGDHNRVEVALRRWREDSRCAQMEQYVPWGSALEAMVLAARGHQQCAHDTFERAAEEARSIPWPYDEARIRYEHGRALLDQGKTTAALGQLRVAREIFERLGASVYLRTTEALLARATPTSPAR